MSTTYTIHVTNKSPSDQDFYFFQKPAEYVGGSEVYSNSLYHDNLQPHETSGSILTFEFNQQYYAGVQEQHGNLMEGKASGHITASQPIELTSAGNEKTNNSTDMTINPSLALSKPTYTPGVQKGAYRITTPKFNPVIHKYNAGLAVNTLTGEIVLSNFINAEPNKHIDCQPVLIFYVQTGYYKAGTVINFTSSSANCATCDTTSGITTFEVDYNPDGSWTVTPVA